MTRQHIELHHHGRSQTEELPVSEASAVCTSVCVCVILNNLPSDRSIKDIIQYGGEESAVGLKGEKIHLLSEGQ